MVVYNGDRRDISRRRVGSAARLVGRVRIARGVHRRHGRDGRPAETGAALVALSSWLPQELAPHLSLAEPARTLPVLIQHGTQDSMIEVHRARQSVETLRQARVPLDYREYEMGHEIRPRSLDDLSAWLEEKVLLPVVPVS